MCVRRACDAMCAWRLLLLAALPALVGVGAGSVLEVRGGPEFLPARRSVTAALGGDVALACRVANLADKAVSWVRARDLQILTHAGAVFSADPRVAVRVSAEPGGAVTHALRLARLRAADAGRYECQLNTEPKLSQIYNLTVTEGGAGGVKVSALGARRVRGAAGGAARLGCAARGGGGRALSLAWYRDGRALLAQSGRPGGVSIDTERSAGRVSSWLTLAALTRADAGRYHCRARAAPGDNGDAPGDNGDAPGEDGDADWAEETIALLVDDSGVGGAEAMQRDESAAPAAAPPARPAPPLLLPALLLLLAAVLH